jgi:hypothetical protein
VTNNNGPLAGVWVALGESDVRTTDAQGVVVFAGSRYALDDVVLTVSDPSMSRLHLSQSRRTHVSWVPWENESAMKVNLPMLEESSVASSEDGDSSDRQGIDLPPLSGDESAQRETAHGGEAGNMVFRLNEELLGGADENLPAAALPATAADQPAVDFFAVSRKFCIAAGLSESLCGQSASAVRPPLRDFSGPESVAQKNPVENSEKKSQLSQTTLADKNAVSSSDKPVNQRQGVRIEVTENGRPLSGARLYMTRLRDNRVREIGLTSADGSLDTRVPKEFFGETITAFHSCCAPRSVSAKLNGQSETQTLKMQLIAGKGFGVIALQQAYGLLRKAEQTELVSDSGKLAVSGNDGFALYDASKTPAISPSKVKVRSARPAEFLMPADSGSEAPLSFIVMPEQTYLPSLAVVERSGSMPFQGLLKNSEVRRWRREFMTRLMRLTSMRTVVSAEVEARVADAGESLPDVMSRGWSETHLAGEWDFLLSMHYDEESGKVHLSAVNARGEEFFENRSQLNSGSESIAAESVARKTFDSFLSAFPFEGSLVQQNGNEIVLSFEDSGKFGLAADAPLAIYQETPDSSGDQRIGDLAALALVNGNTGGKGKGRRVEAKITHWNLVNRKTEVLPDVVRIVKISREDYQKAGRRRGMKVLQTSGLDSRRNKPL